MLFAADDVGDLHREVIADDDEVVGRRAVAADHDPIVDVVVAKAHVAAHEVLEPRLTVRDAETDRVRLTGGGALVGLGLRNGAAAMVVALGLLRCLLGSLQFIEALRRTEAPIRGTRLHEVARLARVAIDALALAVRRVRAADVGPFVPVDAEPTETFEDRGFALLGAPGPVGVLDA